MNERPPRHRDASLADAPDGPLSQAPHHPLGHTHPSPPRALDSRAAMPEPPAPWRLSFHRSDGADWRARIHGPGGFALDFNSPFELARWCMAQAQQESPEARRRSGHSSLR